MPTSTVIFEDVQRQIVQTTSAPEIPPDAPGGWISTTEVWKPGSTGANDATLRSKAQQALAANATFLALATPTNAQNAAQLKAVTREVNGLIRLLLGALQDVSDT